MSEERTLMADMIDDLETENETLHADLEELAVAGAKVLHSDERGQGTPFAAAMYDLHKALDRPGVQDILKKRKEDEKDNSLNR